MSSRFVVAILPPDEICTLVNPIRDQFEVGVSAKLAPHVSLTYPFWPLDAPDEVIATLATISKNYQPFQAKLNDIGFFSKDNGNKVMHLKIGPIERMVEINQTLNRVLGSLINYDTSFFPNKKLPTYDPHLTVAIDATPEQIDKVQELLGGVVGKEFLVDAFYLLENPENSPTWRTFQKFPLGN